MTLGFEVYGVAEVGSHTGSGSIFECRIDYVPRAQADWGAGVLTRELGGCAGKAGVRHCGLVYQTMCCKGVFSRGGSNVTGPVTMPHAGSISE